MLINLDVRPDHFANKRLHKCVIVDTIRYALSSLVAKLNAGGTYTVLGTTGSATITVLSINTAVTPAVATIQIQTGSAAPTTAAPTAAPSAPTSAPTVLGWSQVYNAAALVQCGNTLSGNTATDGANNFGNAANEVFYRITLASTTTLSVTTCGSSYDTYLRLDSALINT
jgi:hypothetical protein